MAKQYYYGAEGQQFSFIQTPKVLVWHPAFADLSDGSKLLYSIMLDRMSLSMKKGYLDEENRNYIIMPIKEVMLTMGCGAHKAVKLQRDLEEFGLIKRRRLGQGRPSRIYICNFSWFVEQFEKAHPELHPPEEKQQTIKEDQKSEAKTAEKNQDNSARGEGVSSELPKAQFKNCQNSNSRIVKTAIQELPKAQFKNCQNSNSRIAQTTIQELSKQQNSISNYINTNSPYNETEYNETDKSQSVSLSLSKDEDLRTDGPEAVRAYVTNQFPAQVIADYCGADQNAIEELIEQVFDVLTCTEPEIRIGKGVKPTKVVQSRFLKLDCFHLAYVLTKMRESPTKIKNVSAYLRTCLYEAPTVQTNYYNALASADIKNG